MLGIEFSSLQMTQITIKLHSTLICMRAGTALWRGHKVNPQSSESLKSFLSLTLAKTKIIYPKNVRA